jgi:hypothetical protein
VEARFVGQQGQDIGEHAILVAQWADFFLQGRKELALHREAEMC